MSSAKKPGAKAREKKTPGTVLAAEVRAQANNLTDRERDALMAHAMRAVFSEAGKGAHAHRR